MNEIIVGHLAGCPCGRGHTRASNYFDAACRASLIREHVVWMIAMERNQISLDKARRSRRRRYLRENRP
jgi:hypothetical protein